MQPFPAGSPVRPALGWLIHPVTVVALLVLLLNDHVFKASWPGTLTGKLSDVAGLALTPAAITTMVAVLVPRLPVRAVAGVATVGVGAAFALAKTTATGAATATAAWSWASGPSTILRDPTDLVALPALGVSWWAFVHVTRHPLPRRAGDLVTAVVVLPAAGLAILATSAGDYPVARDVIVRDGALLVTPGDTSAVMVQAIATTDGRTWRDRVDPAAPTTAQSFRTTRACLPGDPRHCFRTVPERLAVQETTNGGTTWTDAWSITPDRQRFLSRAYPESRRDGSDVAAQSLGILPLDANGTRFVVAVAAGRDGILVRHDDGRWERIGFPTAESRDLGIGAPRQAPGLTAPGERIAAEYLYAALPVTLGLLLGGFAAATRPRRLWSLAAAGGMYAVVLVIGSGIGAVLFPSSVVAALLLVTLALAVWLASLLSDHAIRPLPGLTLAALAVATVVTGAAPFIAWSAGRTDYPTATNTAVWLAAAGIAAMTATGTALGRRQQSPARPAQAPQSREQRR
jgi:hypothetical protein